MVLKIFLGLPIIFLLTVLLMEGLESKLTIAFLHLILLLMFDATGVSTIYEGVIQC